MKETLYLTKELAILNYSAGYAHSGDQLLNSSTFSNYVHNYLDYLKADNEALYFYALNGKTTREATFEILKLFRMLRVVKAAEVDSWIVPYHRGTDHGKINPCIPSAAGWYQCIVCCEKY